jgi:hypothetical protein
MILTYEAIAKRAFEIWDREGRPQGQDQEHWYRAECELRKDSIQAQEAKGGLTAESSLRSSQPERMNPAAKRNVRPVGNRSGRSQARSSV